MSSNPLENYVLNILKENGYDKLDEADQKLYLIQFTAEAERRMGAELLPLLDEKSAKKFTELMEKENTSQEEWGKFWVANVPDFQNLIKKVMKDFAAEVRQSFQA